MSDTTGTTGTAASGAEATADGIDQIRLFLAEQDLVPDAGAAVIVEFGGGVSSQVVEVTGGGRSLVVKRSLPRLRVASDWPAKLERAMTEVHAMRFLGPLTPGQVPAVLATDSRRFMFAMERAPRSWVNWKEELLAGRIDPGVAERLGQVLGTWHERTWRDAEVARRFDDHEAFDQLRLDPFYRTSAAHLPELAQPLLWHMDEMALRRRCLVHGDYSPKNVLLGADGMWVLDYEVAHFGDPVFDLAFMLHHLLLKGVHATDQRELFRDCSSRFLAGYRAEMHREPLDETYLTAHVACLALSRVHGKSLAGYLTEPERQRTTELCAGLLRDPAASVDGAWGRLDG